MSELEVYVDRIRCPFCDAPCRYDHQEQDDQDGELLELELWVCRNHHDVWR